MSTQTLPITENAVVPLESDDNLAVSHARKTTVVILENSAGATVVIGIIAKIADVDTFVPYADGAITDDGTFNHGRGSKLAANVSGITGDSVTIGFYQA